MGRKDSLQFVLSGVVIGLTAALAVASAHADTLDVEALHDVPAPVEVRAQGWDSSCTELYSVDMLWTNNDNNYGTETITIPSTTAILRFTFTNDSYTPGGPDNDRNFILDYWERGASRTQGEAFDRTGGTDSTYPGCGKITWEGRAVTDCGNQNDWVEYGSATEVTCTPADCSDGLDNDDDGDTDCADPDCTGVGSCAALGDVDHYRLYSLYPEGVSLPPITLEDQFGTVNVELTSLERMGVPVIKAIAPDPPSGSLLRPDEHLAIYGILTNEQPDRIVYVVNQFGVQEWTLQDGGLLMVPAVKDEVGAITLGQHWLCYYAVPQAPAPGVTVNLLDQFQEEEDVVVGTGRFLCNPVEKNNEGPPSLPETHLACYTANAPSLNELHQLDDQFGTHPDLFVENPGELCVPSLKYLPEPGALLSFGPGLMLLGWLDYRRRRRAH